MANFPSVQTVNNKEELILEVKRIHEFLYEFYEGIPIEYFNGNAIPEGWTPRQNLKHLISSNKYFGLWIGAPRFLLSLLGKPKEGQIPIEKISATNRKGIKDYGKYRKDPNPNPRDKEELLKKFRVKIDYLVNQIESRTEDELEKFRAPFGGMNLKTFVFFILKHNLHHSQVVQLRLNSGDSIT